MVGGKSRRRGRIRRDEIDNPCKADETHEHVTFAS